MVRVDLGRKTISALLGTSACSENKEGQEVCVYVNARSDKRVYIKVTVDGKKVAYAAFNARDIIAMLVPAVFATVADAEDIETLWRVLRRTEAEKEEAGTRKRARKVKRAKGEEEEEGDAEEEEESLELL